jgi:hypothetical protein
LWRSPLGAVAIAIAATGYWSTVAWLVAARTTASFMEVVDPGDDRLGPSQLDEIDQVDGVGVVEDMDDSCTGASDFPVPKIVLPRAHRFEDYPHVYDVPGYRNFSYGYRPLGLATNAPSMMLLDHLHR